MAAKRDEYATKQAARYRVLRIVRIVVSIAIGTTIVAAFGGAAEREHADDPALVAKGKAIFRFETFGDETKWSDVLRLHETIRAAVDPTTALSVGLKVDAEALPAAVVDGIKNGSIDLKSPATTHWVTRAADSGANSTWLLTVTDSRSRSMSRRDKSTRARSSKKS